MWWSKKVEQIVVAPEPDACLEVTTHASRHKLMGHISRVENGELTVINSSDKCVARFAPNYWVSIIVVESSSVPEAAEKRL